MESEKIEEKQAWATCFFTDILRAYLEETFEKNNIDHPALFRGSEGFEKPEAMLLRFLKPSASAAPYFKTRSSFTAYELQMPKIRGGQHKSA